jgi:hypothetical protein
MSEWLKPAGAIALLLAIVIAIWVTVAILAA